MKLKCLHRFSLSFLVLFLPILLGAARYSLSCSGACASNCISWALNYEVDCNCRVTEFDSFHLMGYGPWGPIVQYHNHETAPGWVGMNAANLGCECKTCG